MSLLKIQLALVGLPSEDLRQLVATITGLHSHREGPEATAEFMRRIIGDPPRSPRVLHG